MRGSQLSLNKGKKRKSWGVFLAGGYLQSVALIRGGRHAYFASPGGIHHGVLDGVTVQLHGLNRDARGDGMPDRQRVIELATATMGALAVEQVAQRLDVSLDVLSGVNRTQAPRQQTLRATID
jgi:hypothetical protein